MVYSQGSYFEVVRYVTDAASMATVGVTAVEKRTEVWISWADHR
jgi:hypothetical protein